MRIIFKIHFSTSQTFRMPKTCNNKDFFHDYSIFFIVTSFSEMVVSAKVVKENDHKLKMRRE